HDARGADRVPDAQRVGERRQRLGADLAVLARAVEQVDGVDQHRAHGAVGDRLAEGREVLLAVGRRAPHARGLVEDLDRLGAALHIGGARTALFNWLLARHEGGELVLRIEDTDRERSTPENIEQIIDALRWLEIDWDEGPIMQTSQTERHQEALQALLESDRAY